MRTITLELLRHGPAHNQLLSPLTQYLALCENHSAVTIRMPFEHAEALYRLRALSYRMGDEPRQFQVTDTARLLGELLGRVPGLTADMNRTAADAARDSITHLRLVLSAAELALLPFELAIAPPGCPGSGQFLLLQPHAPVCITRETRRIVNDFGEWPTEPKVLVVIASPRGYEPVPAGAHVMALRKLLEPWILTNETERPADLQTRLQKHLTVLTNATIDSVEAACATQAYTHVHILAHGHERREGYDIRFGLALHKTGAADGEVDVVSGERLATALRTASRDQPGRLSRPAVVTLASCFGGNVGSVIGVGASIAHALHEAGIPMVIASQFPLSFEGSVRLVEILYEGFFWGSDPRRLLVDLRRAMHAEFPSHHDWASTTAYSSLPRDLEARLPDIQVRRAMSSINVALGFADDLMDRLSGRAATRARKVVDEAPTADPQARDERLLELGKQRVLDAKERLARLLDRHPALAVRIKGYLASTEKREAAIRFKIWQSSRVVEQYRNAAYEDALRSMERARALYWDVWSGDRNSFWAVVQYLSLTSVLKLLGRRMPDDGFADRKPATLWDAAELQSLGDLRKRGRDEVQWALGNLIELDVLAPMIEGVAGRLSDDELLRRAVARAQDFATSDAHAFSIFSTRRQIARYVDWFALLTPLPAGTIAIANAVLDILPESPDPGWTY